MYIAMMGGDGSRKATELAILNAIHTGAAARRLLSAALPRRARGRVAHEFILDLRPFKASAGIEAEDVAKRLMDFGFHAPTMSFPVAGTLMIEPTESESGSELDRFCEAIAIRGDEIRAIEDVAGSTAGNNPSRTRRTRPTPWSQRMGSPLQPRAGALPARLGADGKFFPAVGRIDNVYGDRNLVCICPPAEGVRGPADRRGRVAPGTPRPPAAGATIQGKRSSPLRATVQEGCMYEFAAAGSPRKSPARRKSAVAKASGAV
ncbi:MAG: hypothetical protein R2862_10985 [Thermoanaerobaculia bacterium]